MDAMSTAPEIERLWRDSNARLGAWFERQTGNAADAEDLVQETFVRVHERLDTLVDAASVRAWVGRIARNVLVDHKRRRAVRANQSPGTENQLETELELAAPAPERDAGLDQTVASWLEDFLARLAPEDAAALRLVDLEGRTQAELAAQTGLSLSGAKSRVQRAREKLRAELEGCCTFAFDARGGILAAHRRADGCVIERCDEDCET
jgi:RNA polymerase sigma-70 factor (ECF subfamily)